MATILTFSPHHAPVGDTRRAAPPADTRAEVIVFPRTDIRALRRLSDPGDAVGPDATPDDDDRA